MATAQDFIFISSNSSLEEAVFARATSFKDRLEALSLLPLETEADIQAYKDTLDTLITDMQALSHSLPEGTRSDDINLGHFRSNIGFEKGIGTAAA